MQKVLETQVDKGEASAIALALETPEATVIPDDYKAGKPLNNVSYGLQEPLAWLSKKTSRRYLFN